MTAGGACRAVPPGVAVRSRSPGSSGWNPARALNAAAGPVIMSATVASWPTGDSNDNLFGRHPSRGGRRRRAHGAHTVRQELGGAGKLGVDREGRACLLNPPPFGGFG